MLNKISDKIFVPVGLPVTERESAYTMPSCVRKDRIRTVNNFPSCITEAPTKVDILKPHRKKSFIEPVNRIPGPALHRETSSCGLLNLLSFVVVEIQAAVMHVPGIARPGSI